MGERKVNWNPPHTLARAPLKFGVIIPCRFTNTAVKSVTAE